MTTSSYCCLSPASSLNWWMVRLEWHSECCRILQCWHLDCLQPERAIVHTAEVFTTASSATSHCYHRNVDWKAVAPPIPGVAGAILGAWILSNIDVSSDQKSRVRLFALDGLLHLQRKSVWIAPQRTESCWLDAISWFFAGFLDAEAEAGVPPQRRP